MTPVLDALSVPPSFPAFSAIEVDALGYLWVREYNLPGEEGAFWTVFDPDGIVQGFVETPEDLRIFEIGADYVLGLVTDALDVEHVQMWELERGRVTTQPFQHLIQTAEPHATVLSFSSAALTSSQILAIRRRWSSDGPVSEPVVDGPPSNLPRSPVHQLRMSAFRRRHSSAISSISAASASVRSMSSGSASSTSANASTNSEMQRSRS